MNIVIAIVLEIYGSVTESVREENKKRTVRAELRKQFKNCDEDEIKRKIQEAREICDREEAKLNA